MKTLQFQGVGGRIPLSFARNLSMVSFAGILQNNIRHSIIPTGIFLYLTPPPQRLNDKMQNATPPTQAQSGATMSTNMPTMQHSRDRRFAYSSSLRSSEEEIQTLFSAPLQGNVDGFNLGGCIDGYPGTDVPQHSLRSSQVGDSKS